MLSSGRKPFIKLGPHTPDFLRLARQPVLPPEQQLGPVGEEVGICPYRNLFGVACPGCGMSRATAHLLDGNVGAAMTYHPLVPLFVAQAIVGSAMWIGHKRGWWAVSRRTVVVIGIVNIVLLSGVWVVRAATGTLPPI